MAKYVVEIPAPWKDDLHQPGAELELTLEEALSAELVGRVRAIEEQKAEGRRQKAEGKTKADPSPAAQDDKPEAPTPSPEPRIPNPEKRRRRW